MNIRHFDNGVAIDYSQDTQLRHDHCSSLLAALESDGIAERRDGRFFISDDNFVRLDPTEHAILGAPRLFPFSMRVNSRNTPSDDDFSCSLELVTDTGVKLPFSGSRNGCIIELEGREYLLSTSQLKFMKALETLQSTSSEVFRKSSDRRVHVLDKIGDIQETADYAGIQTDEYLSSFKVVRPDKIKPDVRFNDDGSVDIFPEASGVEMSVVEKSQYAKKALRGARPRKAVSVGSDDSTIEVLHSEPYREGLGDLKDNRHIDPDEAGDFVSNPTSYFSNPDLFDLDGFSDRVVGLAEIAIDSRLQRGKSLMNINWDQMQLLPEATIGQLDPEALRIETVDDLNSLEMAFERARSIGVSTIVFKGNIFRCDLEQMERFIQARKDLFIAQGLLDGSAEEALERLKAEAEVPEKSYIGLLIHDNVEELHVEEFETDTVDYRVPESLQSDLYQFQKEGLLWLQQRASSRERAGLLADDMGLGKTLQLLSFVAGEMESGDDGPFLVIVPTTLLDNWKQEFERHFTSGVSRNCLILHRDFVRAFKDKGISIRQPDGTVKHFPHKKKLSRQGLDLISRAGLVITNYELVRDYQISLGEVHFSAIICDEIQKAKNPSAQLTTAVKAMNAIVKIASTATPVENSLQDLWSIVDFMSPGYLGTLRDFRKRFVPASGVSVPDRDIEYLRSKLDSRKLLLRRTKEDMLDLPEKKSQTSKVPMSIKQKELYSQAVQVRKHDWTQVLGVLQNMIKICSHPYLAQPESMIDSDISMMIEDCPKLGWTLELLDEIRQLGEKVIIFTQYRKMHQILHECIAGRYCMSVPIISGETSIQSRQQIVDSFNGSAGFNVMLLSPLAAGVGLTITGANHVIHYTRLWNPAKEDQATDRAYRIGQKREVTVYYPIVEASEFGRTIEEYIDELLTKKREVSSSFLVPSAGDSEVQKAIADMLFAGDSE